MTKQCPKTIKVCECSTICTNVVRIQSVEASVCVAVNEVFNNTLSGIIYVALFSCGLEFSVLKPNPFENV